MNHLRLLGQFHLALTCLHEYIAPRIPCLQPLLSSAVFGKLQLTAATITWTGRVNSVTIFNDLIMWHCHSNSYHRSCKHFRIKNSSGTEIIHNEHFDWVSVFMLYLKTWTLFVRNLEDTYWQRFYTDAVNWWNLTSEDTIWSPIKKVSEDFT